MSQDKESGDPSSSPFLPSLISNYLLITYFVAGLKMNESLSHPMILFSQIDIVNVSAAFL